MTNAYLFSKMTCSWIRPLALLLLSGWLLTTTASAQTFTPITGAANPLNGVDLGNTPAPTLADVDGDGDLDAIVGNENGVLSYFTNTGTAIAPAYAPGTVNPFSSVKVNYRSASSLGDVDGDGDLDILVGATSGGLYYLKNVGTATAPVYTQQTGTDNPFSGLDVGNSSSPSLGDVDGDGDLDVVVGEVNGTLHYLKNVGTATAPLYAKQTGANNPFAGVDVGSLPRPSLGDVDGDGDLDALVGADNGTFLYLKNGGTATAPLYAQQTGAANPFNGVDVGGQSAPSLGDLDGDGDLDAIVGEQYGTLLYFKNTLPLPAPVYAQKTGTANPFNGVDVGAQSTSTLGDVDGDGDLDAVVGEVSGTLLYYKNTGTAIAPVYTPQTGTDNPFNGLQVGNNSAPSLGDIDGDGDLDVVVGERDGTLFPYTGVRDGTLFYYKNTGTATAPLYVQQTGAANPFNGVVGTFATPSLGDIDGDGDLDALVGEYEGTLLYYKNTGTATAPVYALQSGANNPFNGVDVGFLSGPSLGDVDGDGDLDAVVGEYDGKLLYYKNTGTAITPVYTQQTGTNNPFNGVVGEAGITSRPSLGDVDGDGDLDAVVGDKSGLLRYYKNTTGDPLITQQPSPASQVVCVGGSASSTVEASGSGTLAYQWYRNQPDTDEPVSGQTSATLTLTGVQPSDAGLYFLRVTGKSSTSVWSEAFTLTILAATPSVPTLAGTPVCAGQLVQVSFSSDCPQATFSAQLSNASGSFASPVTLGPVTTGSPNALTIPAGTPTGSGYRIRVRSTTPASTGDSSVAFAVTGLSGNFNSTATVSQVPACAGASIRVSFTQAAAPACSFPLGNVFSAELSDATGSFAAPTPLGTVSPGLNTLTIPQNTPGGSGYRVRIAATTNGSSAYSTPSAAFTVNAPGFSSTPTVSADNKCAGEAVRLSFSVASCAFPVGNMFTAQLSNASGSFAAPVSVGIVTPGGLNNVLIPANTAAGTGYKLRIVSSNPVVTSAGSGNFKVKACGNTREVAPEEAGLQVSVRPNPSPEGRLRITVSGAEGQALKVELFNGMGHSVRETSLVKAGEAEVLDWDLARQPGGLYLLRVSSEREAKTLKVLH